MTLEFRTAKNLLSPVRFQIVNNQERSVSVFSERNQFLERQFMRMMENSY